MSLWKRIKGLFSRIDSRQTTDKEDNKSKTEDINPRNDHLYYFDDLLLSLNVAETYSLQISDPIMSQLPGSVGRLIYLTELDLSNNILWWLPVEMIQLEKLEKLNLSCNKFTVFPIVASKIPTLRSLDLSMNDIKTLPSAILKLKMLTILNLQGNKIEFPLPDCEKRTVQEIFDAFNIRHKERGRQNMWANWMPSYLEAPQCGVRRLTDLCTDCILYNKINYNSGENVPPVVKAYLYEEEHSFTTSNQNPNVMKCSVCKKYFTTKHNFIYHVCY